MPSSSNRDDPYSAFNFLVEIQGVTVAGFSECSGLSSEVEPIEYRNGNEVATVRKLPGLKKFSNITLKRGYTQNRDLWEWYKTVLDGKTERQAGTIKLLNEERQTVLSWTFREGWPCKWIGPSLNAKSNEVAIETLEIAVEEILQDEV